MGRSNLPEAVVEAVDPHRPEPEAHRPLRLHLPAPCPPPGGPCNPCPPPSPCGCCAENDLTEIPPPASAPASTATWPSTGAAGGCMSPWDSSPWSGWAGLPAAHPHVRLLHAHPGVQRRRRGQGTRIPARSSARSASPVGEFFPPAPCPGWRRSPTGPAAATTAAADRPDAQGAPPKRRALALSRKTERALPTGGGPVCWAGGDRRSGGALLQQAGEGPPLW